MGRQVEILSPAKINLHLQVNEKRSDGFHNLSSIFQLISLFDEIEIREDGPLKSCKIEGPFDFPQEENIMFKALNLFRNATSYDRGIRISIKKNIPMGGGLGGGSSNAAAVIKGLELLSSHSLENRQIKEISETLGSDVPFFFSTPTAYIKGRGEIIEAVKTRTDYKILLCMPDFSMNTADAFKKLSEFRNEKNGEKLRNFDSMKEMYEKKSIIEWDFCNSFLNYLKKEQNVLEHIVNLFYYAGADFAGMSGSGSVLFGIFSKHVDSVSVLEKFSDTYGNMLFVNPLDTAMEAALQLS